MSPTEEGASVRRSLKLTMAYDGTNYVGWQRQARGTSIQQLVEGACAPLAGGDPPAVAGAGRTDAGVHALGQVASVTLPSRLSGAVLQRALNVRLPPDVRILSVEDAAPDFHARFDARRKCYRYRIAVAPVVSPFERWFVHHAPEARNVEAMQRAAASLVGRHDFASFQTGARQDERAPGALGPVPSADTSAGDTVRTLHRVELVAATDELRLEVEGDGFLRHMVRTIAGTLIEIGAGRRSAAELSGILAARDRRAAGRTAPACGLTLLWVEY
jgi:tRNA pseudouridine38-40 synthase